MPQRQFPNYLRTFRKRSGLSQDEVAFLLGGENGGMVSRYEQFNRVPSLETACAYEALFGVPTSQLFAGVSKKVSNRLGRRASPLANRLGKAGADSMTARKLAMLRTIGSQRVRPAPVDS